MFSFILERVMLRQPTLCVVIAGVASLGSAAPYSSTGSGSSTIGAGGNYATISAACAAVTAAGSRDASEWTFLITGNVTETANSSLMCTVNPAGGITFRPQSGKQVTVTWPLLADSAGISGRIVVGGSTATATVKKTDNITFDGSNTPGGSTRDMFFVGAAAETTSGYFVTVAGNSDSFIARNLSIQGLSTAANASCIAFRPSFSDTGASGNYCPDNWIVDNCLLQQISSASGQGINGTAVRGTVPSATAMSGWSITNNTFVHGSRAIFLTSAGGNISGNTFRQTLGAANQDSCILHNSTNGATGWTWTIDKNVFDVITSPNVSPGDFGTAVMIVGPGSGAGTYHITNNSIAGFNFTGATSVDQNYQAIRVGGTSSMIVNIEHNSISMPNTPRATGVTAGRVAAISRTNATATPAVLSVKNNIIRFLQTTGNPAAVFAASSPNLTIDGNNIVTAGSNHFGSIAGVTYNTFPAWQGAGYDINGQNIDPTTTTGGAWASPNLNQMGDLHFLDAPTNLLKSTVANTSANSANDIDGESRGVTGNYYPGSDQPNAFAIYSWVGGATGDMSVASNWSDGANPRTTPKATDILQVNSGGPVTILVRDQHISGLQISNATALTLRQFYTASAINHRLAVLDGNNGPAGDLVVDLNSSVTYTGGTPIITELTSSAPNAATGEINGDILFASTAASAGHRIFVRSLAGLIFRSGASCSMAPSSTGGGTGFGAVADSPVGSVKFESGSTWNQSATKAGVRSGGTGSSPFSTSGGAGIATFEPGSNFINWGSTASVLLDVTGRTFGNYVWRSGFNATDSGAMAMVITDTLTLGASGLATAGTLTFGTGTSATVAGLFIESGTNVGSFVDNGVAPVPSDFTFTGNIDISANPTNFTPNHSADRLYRIAGTTTQTINFSDLLLAKIDIVTSGGDVNMTGGLRVGSVLKINLSAGNILNGANVLELGTGVGNVGTYTQTAGHVVGQFKRWMGPNISAWPFPIGTVTADRAAVIDFTTAPTAGGSLTASFIASDPGDSGMPLSDDINLTTVASDGFWTVTAADGLAGGTYTALLNASGFADITDASGLRIVKRTTAGPGAWTIDGTPGTNSGAVVVRTGMSGFSDFSVAGNSQVPVSLSGFTLE